jgi:dTMP kinase
MYQMTKLDKAEWEGYLDWLTDLEFEKLGLPKPDMTIFLDMPTEVSQKLLTKRYDGDDSKKDIHERDTAYLSKCREAALYAAKKYGWDILPCSNGGEPRSVHEISLELIEKINNNI